MYNLSCALKCEEGEVLKIGENQQSQCQKCPSNTYSTTGVLIDGLMGDWNRIQNAKDFIMGSTETIDVLNLPIEYNCYHQDETFKWVQNLKCKPWEPNKMNGGKTLKAFESSALGAYTAYEMIYNAYLKTAGYVEFKYRKDSKSGFSVNGEFKFAVNNREVLLDYKVANQTGGSDWDVYRYNITSPGVYALTWIYTKYMDLNTTSQTD